VTETGTRSGSGTDEAGPEPEADSGAGPGADAGTAGDASVGAGGDAEARILEAARHVLVEEGVEALSMRAVARRVGVSAPAIYHYFENKRELVDRLVDRSFRKVESYLREAADACPRGSLERIRAIEEGYIQFAFDHEHVFRVLFALRAERLREMETHPARGCHRLLDEAVTDAMESGELDRRDPEAVVLYLWSAVHGLVTLSLACKLEVPPGGRAVGAGELFDRSWEMMLDGLRPREGTA
jgi:AcrR family transcriptional regulator